MSAPVFDGTLTEGQYELTSADLGVGGGLLFGIDTAIDVAKLAVGEAEEGNNDQRTPRGDGTRFGRDYRAGRLLTFTGQCRDAPGAPVLAAYDALASAWDAAEVRRRPQIGSWLRWRRGGRTRWVYGRSRACTPVLGWVTQGIVPYVATFQTGDPYFYSDDVTQTAVPFVPAQTGGLGPGPLIGPIYASTSAGASAAITVSGSRPSWLTWLVRGPIDQPGIVVPGRWSATLRITLAAGQYALVDPSPWGPPTVRRNDGANLAGRFTADSQRLSEMTLPPGSTRVQLVGSDPTGTAVLTAFLRDTYAGI